MSLRRRLPTATVLDSGKVLVVGGWDGEFLASAEVYDPSPGTWLSTGALALGREGHTATLLSSGEVLVAGGEIQSAPGYTATASLYSPQTGLWTQAGATSMARAYSTATLLPSGKVLIAGGGDNSGSFARVDVYDPAGGWSVLPSSMNDERRRHTATLLPSGKLLVVGGRGWRIFETAEVYDPSNPQSGWAFVAPMVTPRYDHTATLLPSGKVLVSGGRNATGPLDSSEVYDPATNSWTVAQMATPRTLHTATLLPSGKVLIAGGETSTPLDTTELYDPQTNSWSASITLRTPRRLHAAVLLSATSKVLVLGGEQVVAGQTARLNTAELLGTCETVTCNTAPSQCHSSAGVCSNGTCTYPLQPAGFSCNDGNACTGNDVCSSTGTCSGTAIACEAPPGQCYQSAGTCSDGSCSYAYKAAGAQCDDGDACTLGETCNGAGGCAGTPVSCSTPPGQCYQAAGTCSGGTCSYAPKAAGTACDDGNAGTINDVCSGSGSCAGVVACTTPPDACHGSPGTYSNGACTYPLRPAGTSCGPGQICTATGMCASGCLIAGTFHAAGTTNPSGACQVCNPSVSTTNWSFKPAATECRAASGPCDVAESCSGTAADCPADGFKGSGTACTSDNNACTQDTCNAAGSCTHPPVATGTSCGSGQLCNPAGQCQSACWIAGVYYSAGATHPSSACLECNPSLSVSQWSNKSAGATCGPTTYGDWGSCSGDTICDEWGHQSRPITTYTCTSGGICANSSVSQTQDCQLNTNGQECGYNESCGSCGGFNGTCGETGGQTCSYTYYTCSNGACQASGGGSWQEPCSRDTGGISCGTYKTCDASCFIVDQCTAGGSKFCGTYELKCGGGSCNTFGNILETHTEYCSYTPPGPPTCPAP
ncbi:MULTISPECIES: kelch repeat-containing protein [unclassified Corallococcus]|uniref:kelch repeat-containing protein n=1 Tax=unclassified Corallococcus TaxID=2685029 RepID=UPI001A8FF703|nr:MULTISPECIES: kelch repeat-containing protein [unclassified Corallococcus]MBN9685632.1 hypothetical protein [Corallococcus sp. NCSPR001]WAS82922.1 hypothetical protein O0N60_26785 [Corallococcus sp. NCRR]